MSQDKTLLDNNRRALNLMRDEVKNVLPDYFKADNPNLITFLEKYYQFMDSDNNPSKVIQDLYKNRDLTQVPDNLLTFIEDELLLGQAYFEGFLNKREAAKFSNILYRSKGTLYTIQQFFRAFFGEDPDVVYTKENVFIVGDSRIGAESLRYITNDQLYQTLAILIRIGIPINKWRDVYKLFAHPAGFYLGGEVQLIGISGNSTLLNMPEIIPAPAVAAILEGVGSLGFGLHNTDITSLILDTVLGTVDRQDVRFKIVNYQTVPLSYMEGHYSSLRELLTAQSPTFDESTDSNGSSIKFSDTYFESFDQDLYQWYDSDTSSIVLAT
jgi:hypothetical protein